MDKYYIATIVSFLVVMNIFLLIKNNEMSGKADNLNNKEIPKHNLLLSNNDELMNVNSTDIGQDEFFPLQLLVFFPQKYCSICIDVELPGLKEIAADYSKYLLVVDTGMEYNLASMIGPKVKSKRVDKLDLSFVDDIQKIENPLILVVDQNGVVQNYYQQDIRNLHKTESFYKRTTSLLNSVYGKGE